MPKLGLISLGCAKNLVDSEHMLARLRDAGWEITEDMTLALSTPAASSKPLRPRLSKPFWRPPRTSRPEI